MSTFVHNEKVNDPSADIVSAALGAAASEGWGNNDLGKAVKLNALGAYTLCGANDPIEGFLIAIEPYTVNSGFSFGSVQRDKRIQAVLAAGQTGVVVGDIVTGGAQTAIGTATTGAPSGRNALVQVETVPGDAGSFVWRVLRLFTDGEAGSVVLLERV